MCGFRGVPERHAISFYARCPRVLEPAVTRKDGRHPVINALRRWGESQQQWAVNGSNGEQYIASAVGCIGGQHARGGWGADACGGGGELRLFLPLNCSWWGGIVTKL